MISWAVSFFIFVGIASVIVMRDEVIHSQWRWIHFVQVCPYAAAFSYAFYKFATLPPFDTSFFATLQSILQPISVILMMGTGWLATVTFLSLIVKGLAVLLGHREKWQSHPSTDH